MVAETITIYTEKNQYRPGETINGYIIMNTERPMLLSDILMEIEGHQNVKFIINYGNSKEICKSKFAFLSVVQSLLYSKEGSNGFIHGQHPMANTLYQPGIHQLPFSFQLPVDSIGSFHLDEGSSLFDNTKKAIVSYKLRASLSQPSTKKLISFESPFFVTTVPSAFLAPIHVMEEKQLSFLCCISKGSSLVSVYSDKNVYAAGEVMYVTVDIDHTNVKADCRGVRFSLRKTRLLSIAGRNDSYKKTEAVVRSAESMIARGSKCRLSVKLQIPNNSDPTYISSNIDVTYKLKVEVILAYASDVIIRCPVTIYSNED